MLEDTALVMNDRQSRQQKLKEFLKSVFLDPTNDWAFKRIFGSTQSREILMGFLNDLLFEGQPTIQEITIKDPYLPAKLRNWKETAVDVRAVLANGEEMLIEMQNLATRGFTQRLNYNAAKVLSGQLKRGGNYLEVRPVTVIAIASFILFPERQQWLSHYTQMERTTGAPYPNGGIDIIVVELPKAKKAKLKVSHPMRDWLRFLIFSKDWRKIPPELKNPHVRQALKMARMNNLTTKESEIMSRRQMYQWDQINIRAYALDEGRAEGVAQGVAQGVAEGVAQGVVIGKAKGKADTLLKILQRRLGELPKTIHAQVNKLNFLQLEKLEEQVLDVPSVKSLRELVKSLG
jgi:predicted transposase/invertase (TIGR01784 family)